MDCQQGAALWAFPALQTLPHLHRPDLIGHMLPIYLGPVPGEDPFVHAVPQSRLPIVFQEAAVLLPGDVLRFHPVVDSQVVGVPAAFAPVNQPDIDPLPVGIDAEALGALIGRFAAAARAVPQDLIAGYGDDSIFSCIPIAHFASPLTDRRAVLPRIPCLRICKGYYPILLYLQ